MTASTEVRASERGPGRPRDPRVNTAAMSAVADLVAEQGYEATTMEAIARRSGVSKTALYRRWPSKGALVYETLVTQVGEEDVHDTGDIVADLRAVAHANMAAYSNPILRPVLLGLLGDLFRDERLAAALRAQSFAPRARQIEGLVRRAVERGDLATTAPVKLMPALLTGPLFYELMVRGRPPSGKEVNDLVARVLDPHLLVRRPPRRGTNAR